MSKFLVDEYPLFILPTLAKVVGLNEAVLLQQIHYWVDKHGKKRGRYLWTYNTYRAWQRQFPFWSVETVRKTIRNLERRGLLVSGNYNRIKYDRTKWYRINYSKLREIERLAKSNASSGQTDHKERAGLNRPVPETNSETSTERGTKGFEPMESVMKGLRKKYGKGK